MSSGSPFQGRARGFLKRVTHGVKKAFKPNGRASTSHITSPPPHILLGDPPARPTPSYKSVPTLPSQSPAQSRPPAALLQLEPTSLPVADGDQLANAKSSLTLAAKKSGAEAWSGLKVALQLLEKSSDVFPPVRSAVAGFLEVVGVFETAAQNQKDYAELASNLRDMVDEFKEHPGEHTSSKMSEALTAMANGLEKEMKYVEQRQQHSGVRRYVQAGQDVEDVRGCYRRVETLCRELQGKALVQMWKNQGKQHVDASLKELNPALKAMYDSSLADVVGRRTCTPGTRQAILAEIRKWADDPEGPKVYWLNGMAGTGKTTLAYSFCDAMQLERRLGASFFCSRTDADSRDVSRIVPTIAHQLGRLVPSYREALIRQMDKDKEIGARRTVTQFEKLVRDPLREVVTSVPEGIVVTIDALDECDRRNGAQDILDMLFQHARDLPIKFLVTCRPEPGLFDTLQSKDNNYRSVLHLHDIETSFVQADITTFLEDELASLSLPREKLGQLAKQAATLFIYAATAVRYIYPKGQSVNSHRRLEDVLSMASKTDTNKNNAIDDLYTAVLAAPFATEHLNPSEKKNIRLVLDTAVCAKEPMSVTTMTNLLGLDDEQDIVYALQHLRSVLHVSEGTGLVSTFHASFSDFMLSHERSKKLHCDVSEHNRRLTLCCFSVMERLLKFNICGLESSFDLDENIPGLTNKIDEAISPELFYACRYWGAHLEFAKVLDSVNSALKEFLATRLLFWMEVLNLRNSISAGAQMLTQIHGWLQRLGGTNATLELVLDAGRFATAFSLSSASRSTPHIYISALPFWPETRPVRVQYWKRTQGMMRLEGSGMEGRGILCLTAWDTAGTVRCVAHSADGARIVSSSGNGTVCVWDAYSGLLIAGPFEGHTGEINSVSFSPNGTRIASGSCDQTICVWDSRSGLLVAGPFQGHSGPVGSVSFSSDGARIVSGSDDWTIRVWDAHTGDCVSGPFKGHSGEVSSVVFSPDGTSIVSGSYDKTIRVWDAHNGGLTAGPFEGHADWVSSVALSPDGACIASGSFDRTIRVWDSRSGLLAGTLQGHTDLVTSVSFSPNSTHIISGSGDGTVRVWDAHSGLPVARPLEGHNDWVQSVAFSPDGTCIVSGSEDRTIRVWDAHSRLADRPFEGHAGWVTSVAFSSDGACIVSGSSDHTICVWEAHTGLLVAGPLKGHNDWVQSVAFSPDGTRIVSGSGSSPDSGSGSSSGDHTIRVWSTRSGLLVAGPFEGHTGLVTSVVFSSDGTRIGSGSSDKTIRVWDACSGLLIAEPFVGHTNWVTSVAFSPNGTRIVSGSNDNSICVWDARSGLLLARPFEGHTSRVNSVSFSPGGIHIVSGSDDNTIRVWDAQSGDCIAGSFEGHTGPVGSVGFSSDGTHIVSGSYDRTIRVWDARSGLLVAGPFEGHTKEVNAVAFSPNGATIVSGSSDRTIRVWAVAPPPIHTPDYYKDWFMDETGLINTRQGQLLLCVPPDLWAGIVRPENNFVIYNKGVLKLDFDDILLGKRWIQCYQSR